MKYILRLVALFGLVALLSPPAEAKKRNIEKELNKLGLHWQKDSDGDYRLVFNTTDNRTQLVIIVAQTNALGNIEIREVISAAYRVNGPHLDPAIAQKLMLNSNTLKLGSWMLFAQDPSVVIFCAQVPVTLSATELRSVLEAVALAADQMELELSGTDEY